MGWQRQWIYNKTMKSWLKNENIEIYSTHNEGTPEVGERFIKTLKNKIYRYTTGISKIAYNNEILELVHQYNNTVHRMMNTGPIDVKVKTFIDFPIETTIKKIRLEVI